jgi:hypothetical protein
MALDMSIVRGPRGMDFAQLYTVRDAVVNGMDWYLGDDKEKRQERYLELKQKALCMSREKVLSDAKIDEKTRNYLSEMDRNMFATYLSYVIGSIEDFADKNNTHMVFDWDMLPGVTVIDSCSWNLKDIFERCAKPGDHPDRETIVELDLGKIEELNKVWQKRGFKLKLTKWIGYFFPNVGYRMAKDCMVELGLNDYWIEINDLLYYREEIEKVAKFMQPSNDRLWLVSSY